MWIYSTTHKPHIVVSRTVSGNWNVNSAPLALGKKHKFKFTFIPKTNSV